MIGALTTVPATDRLDLLAAPVAAALAGCRRAAELFVAEIDPELADTAAFCERYDVALEVSANCVVVAGQRGGGRPGWPRAWCWPPPAPTSTAWCAGGWTRARRRSRRWTRRSTETGMEYGGITPIGLPGGWPLLVDAAVVATPYVVIGSGLRRCKIVVPGADLALLPGAEVLDLAR